MIVYLQRFIIVRSQKGKIENKMLKQTLMQTYGNHMNDRGSTGIQIALLTARILQLSQHLKNHKKDYASQRGLSTILGKRKRLLKYLSQKDPVGYEKIINSLGIRGLKSS